MLSAAIQASGKNSEQILQDKENCIRPCILWGRADMVDTQSKATGAIFIIEQNYVIFIFFQFKEGNISFKSLGSWWTFQLWR